MDANLFLSRPLYSIISIFLLLVLLSISYCQENEQYEECSRPFDCGILRNLSYPFWGSNRSIFCGHKDYNLTCEENQYPVIEIYAQKFHILHINKSRPLMTIARVKDTCPDENTLIYDLFKYTESDRNISLFYNCNNQNMSSLPYSFPCTTEDGRGGRRFYADDKFLKENQRNLEEYCSEVKVPVQKEAFDELLDGKTDLNGTLKKGFEVQYLAYQNYCSECKASGGKCGSNITSPLEFTCFCRDQPYSISCPEKGKKKLYWTRKILIAVPAAGIGILLACIIIYCFGKKISSATFTKITIIDQDLEAFTRNHGIKKYSFLEVKKMTNSFKFKVGQGGYGGVYKGKLLDGHLVAVKVLNTSKGDGQEFINEVASISKTSHVNIVTLIGFSLERQKRALIYEFMPNGSLEKFIYKENNMELEESQHLGWENLLKISIGIAKGLEYLHRGCRTRILHFDIKPHNILLDEDFCPKISDFGLAKLCTGKESIVSMLEARGTIGYIAPEVFNRNFGGVSHKSDVYSYGMMVIEMAGGRKNINVGLSKSSEIYFPHWIYKRLELREGFELHNNMTEDENEIARKVIIVGLWCIQMNPSDRPSMSKVIEMLEGSIEVLQVPPNPFFSSPTRSPSGSTATSIS